MRKELESQALELLESSLKPLPHEKSELDWKSDLSNNSDKLAQHLSAFSNNTGGGFLVFGINDNGIPEGVRDTAFQKPSRLSALRATLTLIPAAFRGAFLGPGSDSPMLSGY